MVEHYTRDADGWRLREYGPGELLPLRGVEIACTAERAQILARRHHWPPTAEVVTAWRNFILRDHDIGRTYALQLIDHVAVNGEHVVVTRKECGGRKELAMLAAAE